MFVRKVSRESVTVAIYCYGVDENISGVQLVVVTNVLIAGFLVARE